MVNCLNLFLTEPDKPSEQDPGRSWATRRGGELAGRMPDAAAKSVPVRITGTVVPARPVAGVIEVEMDRPVR